MIQKDDDFGTDRGDADLDTGISILTELTSEEFVQFSVEDAVTDELPLLGDVLGGGHCVPVLKS